MLCNRVWNVALKHVHPKWVAVHTVCMCAAARVYNAGLAKTQYLVWTVDIPLEPGPITACYSLALQVAFGILQRANKQFESFC